MLNLLNFLNLMLLRTDFIFYILAGICFIAFMIIFVWYMLSKQKDNNPTKQTKAWTIESAKKFLEANNIDVKENSNEKVEESLENPQTETKIKTKSTAKASAKNQSKTTSTTSKKQTTTKTTKNENKTIETQKGTNKAPTKTNATKSKNT